MVSQENLKQLTDLVILGFEDLFSIVEAKYGNAESMEEKGLGKSAYLIFTVLPQVQVILQIFFIYRYKTIPNIFFIF